jgi:hypothetical protein
MNEPNSNNRPQPLPEHKLYLLATELTSGFRRAQKTLEQRLAPQDHLEYEFVAQYLASIWQRGRFQAFDVFNWNEAFHGESSVNFSATHLGAGGRHGQNALQRSRTLMSNQDRAAQAFHRALRSWSQHIAPKRPKEPR